MSRKWFHNSALWFHHKIPEYNDEKQGLKKSTEIYEDMFPRLATLNFERIFRTSDIKKIPEGISH